MGIQEIVLKGIDEALEAELVNNESLRSLCNDHPRLNLFKNRVIREVFLLENPSLRNIQLICRDFTKMFVKFAKTHKDHQLMTDCQVDAMNAKQKKAEEAEQLWNEIIVDRSHIQTLNNGKVEVSGFD